MNISRQKLIEELESDSMDIEIDTSMTTLEIIKTVVEGCHAYVMKIIKSQPPADVPDTNVGEWIPCSERLPNKDDYSEQGYVLAQYDIPQRVVQFIGYYDDFVKCWFNDAEEIAHEEYVIAWMPLPEPYKGVE